ncbi:hypothetical protein H5407_13910 [Mitsuaria sp. WAJ17]|uniref:hypothetical protein n=1 Tax=Mitsuaria sp. WAJ17 TaxID=2761452 RepID=UPI0016045365|nr:hypothetical protein [Mitsuaria sp. WAJ17]MBB2486314.1 hypothetical protein [Mitsuaria sp. WAJ17]
MGKSLRARATDSNGGELTVDAHETDALALPVPQLERLHTFRPDLVDFVVDETRKEAAHRRAQDNRINTYVFVERMFGQLAALLVAAGGIGGGVYAGLNGQAVLGGTIATITIGTLAVAFLQRGGGKRPPMPQPAPQPKKN